MAKHQQQDVPHARIWIASTRVEAGTTPRTLFLECERWFDARRVARARLGADVDVVQLDPAAMPRKPRRRVQVRWTGSAASGSSGLRLEVRDVGGKRVGAWGAP